MCYICKLHFSVLQFHLYIKVVFNVLNQETKEHTTKQIIIVFFNSKVT